MNDSISASEPISKEPTDSSGAPAPSARATSAESDGSTSSRSLPLGGADKLSGFFTPVWEHRHRGDQPSSRAFGTANSEPLQSEPTPSDAVQSAFSSAAESQTPGSESQVSASQDPESLGASGIGASSIRAPGITAPAASVLLRRLRRTLRLYTPLPEDIRATVEKHRLQ